MGIIVTDEKDVEWKDMKEWKDCKIKVLAKHPDTGATAALFKLREGGAIPRHKHPCSNFSIQLEGESEDAEGNVAGPGVCVFMSANTEHGPFKANKECLFFDVFAASFRVE